MAIESTVPIAILLCAPVMLIEPTPSMVSVLLPPVRVTDVQLPLSVYVALPCKMLTTGSLPQSHVAPLPARNTLSAFATDELAMHAMAAIHTTSLVMVPPRIDGDVLDYFIRFPIGCLDRRPVRPQPDHRPTSRARCEGSRAAAAT